MYPLQKSYTALAHSVTLFREMVAQISRSTPWTATLLRMPRVYLPHLEKIYNFLLQMSREWGLIDRGESFDI
jgi:hypothetical protein